MLLACFETRVLGFLNVVELYVYPFVDAVSDATELVQQLYIPF